MASLLAFSWRRKGSENAASSCNNLELSASASMPGVSESSSGESINNHTSECQYPMYENSRNPPETPEGLRPRRTAQHIRREMRLPRHPTKQLEWNPLPINSTTPALPPLGCGAFGSPQVSTSSFYSKTSDRHNGVAVSPNLKVGKAKTAVGALLAMNDAGLSFHETSRAAEQSPARFRTGILPPRKWIDVDRADEDDSNYSDEPTYEPLNDSRAQLTPNKKRKAGLGDSLNSPSDDSSVYASPSSNNWRQPYSTWRPENKDQSSFTESWLMDREHVTSERYDFDSIMNHELCVAQPSENATNVSAISHSTKENESHHSLIDDEDDNEAYDYHWKTEDDDDEIGKALRKQKMLRQRRSKEDLLIAAVERLQDDTALVAEVIDVVKVSNSKWDESMNLGNENIFKGYSVSTKTTLCRNIDAILNEMNLATPEEFFLSPTQIPDIAATHDDLYQALSFCRSLISAASFPGGAHDMGHL